MQDQWCTQAREKLSLDEAATLEMDPACAFVKLVIDLPNKDQMMKRVKKKMTEAEVQQFFRDLLRDMVKLLQ